MDLSDECSRLPSAGRVQTTPTDDPLATKTGRSSPASTGSLRGKALDFPVSIVLGPDRTSLYVASLLSGSLTIFDRDTAMEAITASGRAECPDPSLAAVVGARAAAHCWARTRWP